MTHEIAGLTPVLPDVFMFESTCHVYILVDGDEAVLIDFGDGSVLDVLPSMGIRRVKAVLMTHYHRDQGQGLPRAVAAGIDIWVPHMEQDLFHSVDAWWQGRQIYNNYYMRDDRFSLLNNVPVAGTLHDYATYQFGRWAFRVIPTPGHTMGSVTLMTSPPEGDHGPVAFTGDLIYGAGKVWSLAATQWSYNGAEGVSYSILSLLDLMEREPALLLPSHGAPMPMPREAMAQTVDNLWDISRARGRNLDLYERRNTPYERITPHLLINRTAMSQSYVVLSKTGKALLIDYGYDMCFGHPNGTDRAARRPWLYSLHALKQQFGVSHIDVVIPTHFHDDHVGGFNLLRSVEGTGVWAPDLFASILERPADYDLPCLWFDPITVDRRLPLGEAFTWEEYTFTLYHQPGHTYYAVAIAFEVDGYQVVAVGDQQGNEGTLYNYVYPNLFHYDDYVASADLYAHLKPDLIIGGHWEPLWVNAKYLSDLKSNGGLLSSAHRRLLPLEDVNFGARGFGVTLMPYQAEARPGQPFSVTAYVKNPFSREAEVSVALTVPDGWKVTPDVAAFTATSGADTDSVATENDIVAGGSTGCVRLASSVGSWLHGPGTGALHFQVTPPDDFPTEGLAARRVRLAADLSADGRSFGQQGEMLVDVKQP